MKARMTVKTSLSFTDRHHRFLSEKVGQGVFATQSAAVAAAQEQMMQDVPGPVRTVSLRWRPSDRTGSLSSHGHQPTVVNNPG
jgi:hypothetical protein